MDVMKHIMRVTGKSFADASRYVRLEADVDGKVSVVRWDADGIGMPQPGPSEIAAWQAQPEYVDLAAYASSVRWQKEVSGIVVSGIQVATDDRSKQMIMGARIAAEADDSFTTPWVTADGNVVTLNAQQIIGVSNAVLAHVAECFAAFGTVRSSIIAGTITTTTQIDQAFAA